jgi:integrase/recombinase XerD
MEKFSLDGVTLSTVLDCRRGKPVLNDKGEEVDLIYPVKYRVTYLRKQYYYPSGIDLTIEEFDIMPGTKQRELTETRELIDAGYDKIKKHIKELVKGDGFSIDGLKARLKRGTRNSIVTEFYGKIEKLEQEGRVTTASSYRCAIRSIHTFTKKDLKFSDITIAWLKKYEAFLLEGERTKTTVGIYMRALRAIMNEGIENRYISKAQYPFGKDKYEIKKGSGRKMALTLSQIDKILKYKLPTVEGRKYRDLWYFSFLCNGINVNDMLRLKYSDIENEEIHFYRGKTIQTNPDQEEIHVTLLPEMSDIIRKWGNPEKKPDQYIFPFLTKGMSPADIRREVQNVTRLINKRMKKIGSDLKYGNITTYNARHSFATVLMYNKVGTAFISKSLGHANQKTTESYLESFDQKARKQNAQILTNKK